jgi:hypothetical protein
VQLLRSIDGNWAMLKLIELVAFTIKHIDNQIKDGFLDDDED